MANKRTAERKRIRRRVAAHNPLGLPKLDPVARCRSDCKYLNTHGMRSCHYVVMTGKPRGCNGGRDCERYAT